MFFFEGITVRNFKSLNCVTFGVDKHGFGKPLTNITCCVGASNSGKSNFLDLFQFIFEVNNYGLKSALYRRGGIESVRTRGKQSPIEFDFALSDIFGNKYRYVLSFDINDRGNIVRKDRITARPSLGATELKDFSTNVPKLFDRLYVPQFTEKGLRTTFLDFPPHDLTESGNNFVYVMKGRAGFTKTAQFFASRILQPLGLKNYSINVEYIDGDTDKCLQKFTCFTDKDVCCTTEDNRDTLSTNALKYIAYIVLCKCLHSFSVVCMETPEQGIYHTLVSEMTEALKSSAIEERKSIFMTTHSQFVLSELRDEDVFVFYRNCHGHTEVKRANDIPYIHKQMQDGNNLGYLWSQRKLHPLDDEGNFPEE